MGSLADVFVRVRPDTKGFGPELNRGVSKASDDAGQKAGKGFSSGWGKGIKGVALATAGAFGAIKVSEFFARTLGDSLAEARESIKVGKLTEQVIKTTGGAARVSAKDVESLATALSRKTGIDDEVIQSGENLLLTFTNVRNEAGKGNDIFNQTTGIMQDMSVALGQDTKSSAIQLGKALNDPIKGLTSLQRVGVSFTKSQKDQIKALVESGDKMGAQKVILAELGKEFGGAAEKAASPADKARVAWGNFEEEIGKKLLPLVDKLATWFATDGIRMLEDFGSKISTTTKFVRNHSGAFKALLVAVGALFLVQKAHTAFLAVEAAGGLLKYLANTKLVTVATKAWAAVQWLMNIALSANPIGLVVIGIGLLVAAIVYAWKNSETFRRVVTRVWDLVKEGFGQMRDVVVSGFRWLVMKMLDFAGHILRIANHMFGWIPGIGDKLRDATRSFGKFKDDVNRALGGIKDKPIKVTAAFTSNAVAAGSSRRVRWATEIRGAMGGPVRGGEPGKDSVPYLLMPGEFIVRSDGSNLVDAMYHYAAPGMAAGGLIPRFRRPGAGQIDRVATNAWRETGGRIGRQLLQDLINTMGTGGGYGSGVSRWSGIVLQVLGMLGQSAAWLGTVLSRMQRESGGNPYAINLWDSNAQRGDPSRGLMQTIMATFLAYAGPFRGLGIYNPLANVYAGLNYALHRYGTLAALSRPGGYDNGGWLPTGMSLAINNTGRPERVLSPSEQLGGRTYIINQHLVPGVHPAEVGRQTVLAIQAFERGNGSEWRTR